MQLYFIFVIKEGQLDARKKEFEYVKKMAEFFRVWIKQKFSKDFEIKCDILVTKPRGLFQRLDTHTLVDDHRSRGLDTYHFYLSHFRPFWTDCTCEGYHAENFGMVLWQQPKDEDDVLFLAEKNCTLVSHQIAHEMLRQNGVKKFTSIVHDVWVKHFYDSLAFEQYGADFTPTDGKPYFLTIDTEHLKQNSQDFVTE